ncbi:MAG: hypothetical protein AAGD01_00760 [Acidobacteriota bacterium]
MAQYDPRSSYKAQREARAAAAKPKNRDAELSRFETRLRQLRIEYEKFFNGALLVPPEEERLNLQAELRRLRQLPQLTSVESFRLNGLEARFNSFSELFQRRVRDREEGRTPRAAAAAPVEERPDARAGIVVDSSLPPDAVEALYVGLAQGGSAPKFDLDSFGRYLGQQLSSIQQKTGASRVQFRLQEKDGKLRLKAKPIGRRGGS